MMRTPQILVITLIAYVVTSLPAADQDAAAPNPQMKAVLTSLEKLNPKPIESLPPVLARLQPSMADAAIQTVQDKGTVAPDKMPPVGKVELMSMSGPDQNPLNLRIYTPKGAGPFPVLVYY